MKNIKKYSSILCLILIIFTLLLVAVACNDTPSPTEEPKSECKHENTKWEIVQSATCTAEGSVQNKCTACNTAIETKTVGKIAHTEEILSGKSATCTEDGLTEGKKCSVCNAEIVKQETIQALGHKESDWIVDKVATASAKGEKHTQCIYCKAEMKSAEIATVSASHVHEGKEWVTVQYPTCTSNGKLEFICECGSAVKSSSLAKLDHSEVAVLGLSSTCTASGKTDGKKCSLCSTIIASQVAIAPKGHSFSDGACTDCGIAANYGLWITDGLGNPMADIFVKVTKDGEVVKMYPYKSEFLPMDLDTDTYQLELDLSQLEGKYTYDEALCVLTPEKRTTSLRLFKKTEGSQDIFVGAPISKDYTAYHINEGSYKVDLTPNDYTFFVFYPTSAAIYTLTYECDSELSISYHGSTFFVQGADLSEGSEDISTYENGLSVNIYPGNIGGSYVFAVRSTSSESCVLNVRSAGDPGTRLIDEPWVPYLEDEQKVTEHLKVNKDGKYTAIDLTDLSISAVFNENDGFYHLNSADGPIIFIDLTSDCQFISSLQTICSNQRMGIYVYDVNGKVVEKRSFNELFQQYGMPGNSDTVVKEAIRVPLTEKLADAIKSYGEKVNWWAEGSEQNIFTKVLMTAPYNSQFAWLLFCGYYE